MNICYEILLNMLLVFNIAKLNVFTQVTITRFWQIKHIEKVYKYSLLEMSWEKHQNQIKSRLLV